MGMAKISQEAIEAEAIRIVSEERNTHENEVAFVTERVAFEMRNLIRQLRRNYYGVFDKPVDPITGRKKIWFPLTESMVENVVKNIDLDTKDINFRSKKAESLGLSALIRNIVKNYLDSIYFGEKLDDFERSLAIDGTAVWKTQEVYNPKTKKKEIDIQIVDLLNCYIDPTAPNIQEAYRFTERSLMSAEEVKGMDGWINTEDVKGQEDLTRIDSLYNVSSVNTTGLFVDVWECWGRIPLWLITGKTKDRDSGAEVEGRIVMSGLDNSGTERLHLIEVNKKGDKPYEEAWYTRVPGRWFGRGVAEKLLMLQLYQNITGNLRVNRAHISQMGLFTIRKGSGVTPQMLGRLASNGAILVNNSDDIQQLVVQDVTASSYNDENVIMDWSQRVTQAFEAATGEQLPASTPATNAVLQARTAQSAFVLIKEQIGFFIQRWMKRHALPLIMKQTSRGDIIRITGSTEELREYDERIVNEIIFQEIEKLDKKGKFVSADEIEAMRGEMLEKFQKMGEDRFVEMKDKIDYAEYDVQVFVTNEEIDKSVLVQNLLSVMQLIPATPGLQIDPNVVVQQIFDVMGLDANQLKTPQSAPGVDQLASMMEQGGVPTQGGALPPLPAAGGAPPTEQGIVTGANTL